MRILIFLALMFVIYYVLKNVSHLLVDKRHVASRRKSGEDTVRDAVVDELVKDPVCGVYVAKKQAIKHHRHGKTTYFCSNDCMKKYLEKKK